MSEKVSAEQARAALAVVTSMACVGRAATQAQGYGTESSGVCREAEDILYAFIAQAAAEQEKEAP